MSMNLEKELLAVFGKIKRANKWIRIPCPTCDPHHRKKMKRYVSLTNDFSKCWICEVPMTTSELLNRPVDLEMQFAVEQKKENPWTRKMPGHRFIPLNELAYDHPASQFLHKDHLYDFDRYYREFGIVFCPVDAGVVLFEKPYTTSAERLIFPVHFNGELVGWQMRSIPGTFYGDRADVVRYIHIFDKGKYLYNYDNARKYSKVVVVEGVKKALKFPNAVATLGKGISDEQIDLLHHWRTVIIMLDGEEPTQKLANEIVERIRMRGRQAINVNPKKYGFDSPDEATTDQLVEAIYKEFHQ